MTTRKRALTAQIKPETRNSIMDQLACAADTIIALRESATKAKYESVLSEARKDQKIERLQDQVRLRGTIIELYKAKVSRRWWHRFAWWRA